MTYQIIGMALVVAFGIISFVARKILQTFIKRDVKDSEILIFKAVCLLLVVTGACMVFFTR